MTQTLSAVVFCGARAGANPAWMRAATEMGQGLARAGIRLVYGGGHLGLMGAVADGVLDSGGQVLGVIPQFLTEWEVAHDRVTNLVVTDSMHSRKRRMFEESDVFISLPGGLGTMDETVEIITWKQLRLHSKPVFICNIGGWADGLLAAFDKAVQDGFASPAKGVLYDVFPDVAAVLARLQTVPATAHGPAPKL